MANAMEGLKAVKELGFLIIMFQYYFFIMQNISPGRRETAQIEMACRVTLHNLPAWVVQVLIRCYLCVFYG